VWDVYGNTIAYHYEEQRREDYSATLPDFDHASYLDYAAYGGNAAEGTPNCWRLDVGLRERKTGGNWYDAGPGSPEVWSLWQEQLVPAMSSSTVPTSSTSTPSRNSWPTPTSGLTPTMRSALTLVTT
jgi:hypothetical protein